MLQRFHTVASAGFPITLGIDTTTLGVNPTTLGVNPTTLGVDPITLEVNYITLGVDPLAIISHAVNWFFNKIKEFLYNEIRKTDVIAMLCLKTAWLCVWEKAVMIGKYNS